MVIFIEILIGKRGNSSQDDRRAILQTAETVFSFNYMPRGQYFLHCRSLKHTE